MKPRTSTSLAALFIVSVVVVAALPASAKTAKECRSEWQAQKTAMQAAHKTEKAYIAECRTNAAATPAATPAADKGDKGSNY